MRLSIVLAIALIAALLVIFIRSTFGEHAVVVYGLFGFYAAHVFFKHVMNG